MTTEQLWAGVNNGDIFDEPDDELDTMLLEMNKSDLRVLRILIDFRLEIDDDGGALPAGTYNDCILEATDGLISKAKTNGIVLLISLGMYNWIQGGAIGINQDFYGWRRCQAPKNVYALSLTAGTQYVYDPYYSRGWGSDFLTNPAAKNAYKQRINHILNHVHPTLQQPWKNLNDVVWAWELMNEPDHLGSQSDVTNWLDEMATHVRSIDHGTLIALGTATVEPGNIQDADIYTQHYYFNPDADPDKPVPVDSDLEELQNVCDTYGKLPLLEEFNVGRDNGSGVLDGHTPGNPKRERAFETIMHLCRRNQIPWMFWEYGYLYDGDDIWYKNGVKVENDIVTGCPDGIFWGAKVLPAAKAQCKTSRDVPPGVKNWGVQTATSALCSQPGNACQVDRPFFVDTFSSDGIVHGYHRQDEGTEDVGMLKQGYLYIKAGVWQDLWGGLPPKSGAPLILRNAPGGDYRAETFVRADDPSKMVPTELMDYPMQPLNTQMGLFAYSDADNWLFFGLTYHDFTIDGIRTSGDGLITTRTPGGVSSIIEERTIYADFMFLKLEKAGDNWSCFWKLEHADQWNLLTTTQLSLGDHQIGMGVKTFDLEPPNQVCSCEAFFDFLSLGANFIGNRRSLEVHKPNCQWVSLMNEHNIVGFTTTDAALNAGYNGCYYCLPEFDTG